MENSLLNFKQVNESIDKTKKTLSISALVTMLQDKFDSQGVATKTHEKHYNDPDSQYYHMSVDEILDAWDNKASESRRYGCMLDDYIGFNLTKDITGLELWKLDNNYEWDERLKGVCDSFDSFYSLTQQSGDTEFVAREVTVYYRVPNTDYYIKGRFDALFRNKKTNKWIVIDWKSSGTIDKVPNKYTNKMYGPANAYPQLNWYVYTIQTHFYKKALLESGYLPEGTTEDDITVMIVQLPGRILENGKNYAIHKEAFPYNTEFLDRLFSFGVQKNKIMSTYAKASNG